jgi:hypothetical protein
MSILLNDPTEFTGGAFTTLEADGGVISYDDFQQGDALVFVSEKYHSVQVVESGTRRTLVTELWLPPAPRGPTGCRPGSSSSSGGSDLESSDM